MIDLANLTGKKGTVSSFELIREGEDSETHTYSTRSVTNLNFARAPKISNSFRAVTSSFAGSKI